MGGIDDAIGALVLGLAKRSRAAARALACLAPADRSGAIVAMADGIDHAAGAILKANALDVEDGAKAGLSAAMIDRLLLDADRIAAMGQGLRDVAALPDRLGEVMEAVRRPNGLVIERVRVPIGVVAVIYESRPNVTADAAAICFKAGNACVLRGGSEAHRSNEAILRAMLRAPGVKPILGHDPLSHAIQLVPTTERAAVEAMLRLEGLIDLVVPRGGEGLIRAVAEHARVPVLKHYKGVCHVYVDKAADLDMALRIAVNAKCQRPGVCNAMETLIVHEAVAREFLPRFQDATRQFNLEIRGDKGARAILPKARVATDEDWSTEYLEQIVSIRVVPNATAALDHIEAYGTRHSDAIVTGDAEAAERFCREVDSAAVYVNASTRFTDGAAFGKGAEIGISTDKLHARGPCGVEELTTYKYVVRGEGQVRE